MPALNEIEKKTILPLENTILSNVLPDPFYLI